jgi:hypothetical protein
LAGFAHAVGFVFEDGVFDGLADEVGTFALRCDAVDGFEGFGIEVVRIRGIGGECVWWSARSEVGGFREESIGGAC